MGRNPPALGTAEEVARVAFGCRPEEIAEAVVLTPFVPLKSFQRYLEEDELVPLRPLFFYKGLTGSFRGVRVTVLQTGVGPSRVGDCLGFLSLTPARRVVFAGAVGSLNPAHAIGDYFVPTEAADGEGYSRYVAKPFEQVAATASRQPCATDLARSAEEFLSTRGGTVRKGAVFTVGSIAFESAENLRCLASLGFDAVEMELSAFFAGASHHGFGAAAITYVSDLPLASSLWQAKSEAEAEALRRAYHSLPLDCLEFLARFGPS